MRSTHDFVRFALFALLPFASSACDTILAQKNSGLTFDGARSVAVDAVIPSGFIITDKTDSQEQEKAIRTQLKYTVGQLNGIGGGPSMERLDIAILDSQPDENNLLKVTYKAEFPISWPRELPIPDSYLFYLPRTGDKVFIDRFLNDVDGAKRCLSSDAHDVGTGTAWYFYRPNRIDCEVRSATLPEIAPIEAKLQFSQENSQGKFPEYAKIWEDGKLVVTAVFAKNSEDSLDLNDPGIQEYRRLYANLIRTYGPPLASTLDPSFELPRPEDKFVQMSFATPMGVMDIEIDLIESIGSDKDKDFEARYNERTLISDFISYSGHAGYGANIRRLAKMGSFEKGQYQIFLLNGCSTFTYVTDALRTAHQAVNPDEGPDKYVDIVLNSLSSYFSEGAPANLALIRALSLGKQSYREILAGIGPRQRVVVTGEQDNADWLPQDSEIAESN